MGIDFYLDGMRYLHDKVNFVFLSLLLMNKYSFYVFQYLFRLAFIENKFSYQLNKSFYMFIYQFV